MVASAMKLFPSWSSDRFLDTGDMDEGRGKAYACRYARKRQWGHLRDLLLRVEYAQLSLEGVVDAIDGQTLLHVVCSHDPPLDVVTTLTDMFPALIDAADAIRRTPLHVAVENGASLEVVGFLVKSKPACAMLKDEDGKTPLMLVCQEIGELDDKDEARYFDDAFEADRRLLYLCDVAQSLAKAVPLSVLVEDEYGMTALEHAINSEAPRKMIRYLQHTTCRVVRTMNLESKRRQREIAMQQKENLNQEESHAYVVSSGVMGNVKRNSVVSSSA
eukprot:CAMPEP_0197437876 /NCGR_PEP_ID=MMETSP1175-20131217/5012_1 /TAXON_ID=1003142 /ORGANISM="Triceratium dubium, Strain CCMP147" /LENGTH=273 /DNA_ID=CAMNT_0042967501 /DNA_START=212 /DNA_END=1033 /DNA_ORIENTATION=-